MGKTSLAAATGLELSRLGYRTLIMSVDPAHSLADAFDLGEALFNGKTGDPYEIDAQLSIHEVNIQKEIKRHWQAISLKAAQFAELACIHVCRGQCGLAGIISASGNIALPRE